MNLHIYLNVWRTAMQDPCGYSHIIAASVEDALRLTENLPGQDCASVYAILERGAALSYAEHQIYDLTLPYHGIDLALPEPEAGLEWWGVLQEDRRDPVREQITVRRFAFAQARRWQDVNTFADEHWPGSNHERGPALVYDMAAIAHHLKAWRAPIEGFDMTFPTRIGHRDHMDDKDWGAV